MMQNTDWMDVNVVINTYFTQKCSLDVTPVEERNVDD